MEKWFDKLARIANYMPWLFLCIAAGIAGAWIGWDSMAANLGNLAGIFSHAFHLSNQ
jgi:hypothetical protein